MFSKLEFTTLFVTSQVITIVQHACGLFLISRKDLIGGGVPMLAFYVLTQNLAVCLEHSLTMLPSFIITAQLVSPGVEGTMLSLSTSLIKLNQFTIREMVGILINDLFIHVTRKNLTDIFYLIEVAFFFSFIPIIFIYFMVPSRELINSYQQLQSEKF